jgi:hypothetical protein
MIRQYNVNSIFNIKIELKIYKCFNYYSIYMNDTSQKNVNNINIVLSSRSNSDDSSISSFDSYENSFIKKELNVISTISISVGKNDEESIKLKKNNWIPIETKRRQREVSVSDNYSKSPQVSDVLRLISAFQNINLNKFNKK